MSSVKCAGRGSARRAIGEIAPGFRLFVINKGQFSLLDIIRAIIQQTGPADLMVTCWAAGLEDIQTLNRLVERGDLKSLRWLVGRGMVGGFQAKYADDLLRFGENHVRTNRVHMKTACIGAGDWRIAIRASANLNSNPQFEQFDIGDDPEIYNAIMAVVDEMWENSPPGLQIPARVREQAFRRALRWAGRQN